MKPPSRRAILLLLLLMSVASTAQGQTGDFNGDGIYDHTDVNQLSAAISSGGDPAVFDLSQNGLVDRDDLTLWLGEAGNANLGPGESYLYGDANFNGQVDQADTDIIQFSKFTATNAYSWGDFNADGVVDAHDNQVAFGNLFTSSTEVDGAGSLGIAVPGKADFYYDPATGKMWMDTGGDRFNAWGIPGVPALAHNELSTIFDFDAAFSQVYFNGEEQWITRMFMVAGVFQIATYATGLDLGNLGPVVEAARVIHPFGVGPVPWQPIDARLADVTIATIKTWNGVDGTWNSGNWLGGVPSSVEVAILDLGSGVVTIPGGQVANSLETLVREGRLVIDGTHAGDVTIFDSSENSFGQPVTLPAEISGSGLIDGDLVLTGTLSVASIGTLSVTGEAILSEGYSSAFSSTLAFARLVLDEEFDVGPGQSTGEFAVLSAAAGIEGVFRGLEVGSNFGGIFVESLTYTDNDVLLSLASLPGDANRDGFVDVTDFNIWNDHKFASSTEWSTGDFNGDGVTDVSDFNIWSEHKFTSLDLNSVPEPNGVWLMVWCVLVALVVPRKSP